MGLPSLKRHGPAPTSDFLSMNRCREAKARQYDKMTNDWIGERRSAQSVKTMTRGCLWEVGDRRIIDLVGPGWQLSPSFSDPDAKTMSPCSGGRRDRETNHT